MFDYFFAGDLEDVWELGFIVLAPNHLLGLALWLDRVKRARYFAEIVSVSPFHIAFVFHSSGLSELVGESNSSRLHMYLGPGSYVIDLSTEASLDMSLLFHLMASAIGIFVTIVFAHTIRYPQRLFITITRNVSSRHRPSLDPNIGIATSL